MMRALIHSLLLLAVDPSVRSKEDRFALPSSPEVVVFLATDCPMAKLYANRLKELAGRYPQVRFRGVCASSDRSAGEVAALAERLGFAFATDEEAIGELGATRSPEAVLLVGGEVVYRGRIDDQYTPGTNRAEPTRRDLEVAIQEVLAGCGVAVAETPVTGCHISLSTSGDQSAAKRGTGPLAFVDVAPIFHERCGNCHRPGQVAPFSLLTYADVREHAGTIREVIDNGRMPPWHADPRFGHFVNDRSLTADEKSRLNAWFAADLPKGEREPEKPEFNDGWSIRPDLVLTMQEPFAVPAEGVLDYQDISLNAGFDKDTWIQAVEIRPGNRAVVHHLTAMIRPRGANPALGYYDELEDMYFAIMGPDNAVTVWPAGVAKLIPAGWELVFSVHYTPTGTPQTDRSSIGLQLADMRTVRKRAATRPMITEDILLQPNSVTTLKNVWKLEDDYTLHSLVPHMHVRGRSMRIEANGEVLLNVPHYDFNWQHRYIFTQPKSFPRGTVVMATAVFDNTANNPSNPDPNATVHYGKQTTDEMFQLNWDISRTNEDRLASTSKTALARGVLGVMVCAAMLLVARARSVTTSTNA